MLRVAECQPDLGSICVFHTPIRRSAGPGAWRGCDTPEGYAGGPTVQPVGGLGFWVGRVLQFLASALVGKECGQLVVCGLWDSAVSRVAASWRILQDSVTWNSRHCRSSVQPVGGSCRLRIRRIRASWRILRAGQLVKLGLGDRRGSPRDPPFAGWGGCASWRIFSDGWWLEGSGKAQPKFWGAAPADFLYGEKIHGFVCKLTNPIVNRVPPGVKPPLWGLLWKSSSRIGRWTYKRGINPRRLGDWGTLSPGLPKSLHAGLGWP